MTRTYLTAAMLKPNRALQDAIESLLVTSYQSLVFDVIQILCLNKPKRSIPLRN
jgi:hypothetical protein